MKGSSVTACIVTHNNMATIEKTVASLLEYSPETFKLFIFDNASSDGTPDFIEERFPQVELIRSEKNLGFGAGHNSVMDKLDSDYHVIINPDITIDCDVISDMAEYMEQNADIGILAPKICFPDGRMQILGKKHPTLKYLVASRLRNDSSPSNVLREYAMLDADYTKPFEIENVSGCFFVIRTELFKTLGGFDEKFFLYFEDCDISRRAGEKSRVVFYPLATVYHEWGRESKRNVSLMLRHVESMCRYFLKWR